MRALFFIASIFLSAFGHAQNPAFAKAPMNPRPLEERKLMLPAALQGDVAYYAGNFYNEKREMILEDDTSFKNYIGLSYNEAKANNKPYIKLDKNGNVVELALQGSSITYYYEYNSKNLLIKSKTGSNIEDYEYDNQNRLVKKTSSKTYSENTVTTNYTYTQKGKILHVYEQNIYSTGGEEIYEYDFEDSRLKYVVDWSKKKYECVPDLKGNCTKRKNLEDEKIEKVYYNVVYREEFKGGSLTVKKDHSDRDNLLKVSVGDRLIKGLPSTLSSSSSGTSMFIYIPFTQNYVMAKDVHTLDKNTTGKDSIVTTSIQEDNPYLSYNTGNKTKLLYKGSDDNVVSYSDDHYDFHYVTDEGKYRYITKPVTGEKGELVTLEEIDAPILMYVDIESKTQTLLMMGKRKTYTFGWTAKKLSDKEIVVFIDNKPTYIAPIIPAPENLKIYTCRLYKGEQIPAGS